MDFIGYCEKDRENCLRGGRSVCERCDAWRELIACVMSVRAASRRLPPR
jgi:hypothetical protein